MASEDNSAFCDGSFLGDPIGRKLPDFDFARVITRRVSASATEDVAFACPCFGSGWGLQLGERCARMLFQQTRGLLPNNPFAAGLGTLSDGRSEPGFDNLLASRIEAKGF